MTAPSIRGHGRNTVRTTTELRRACRDAGIPVNVPWYDLTAAQQDFVLEGKRRLPRRTTASFG